MRLNSDFLLTEDAWCLPTELYSCWNARGLYSPLQFVLRLRPDIHKILNSTPVGQISRDQLSDEQLLAFSTYLHENIHWWQHVGSITGLFLSLIYPAQAHVNYNSLKKILAELGPVKSILEYNQRNVTVQCQESDLVRNINIVLNNWHDLEFYRCLVTDPRNIREKVNDSYFESVGHSYHIAIGAVIWLLSATVDPELDIFPDPRKWESRARRLCEEKVQGFYYGSDIILPPIGAKEIFEGQARFCQLQYLYLSSGRSQSWEDFQQAGMLEGIYVEAFKYFLNITGIDAPSKLDDSVVGLFLLVCDISINPGECFAEDIAEYERLIMVHDPGYRFIQLCKAIKDNMGSFVSCIISYSAEEYWRISDLLCSITRIASPKSITQKVALWAETHQSISRLLDEDGDFNFSLENLPVRLFLGRFIRLQTDKTINPEFFCWPGIWMISGQRYGMASNEVLALFEEHRAVFLDKDDGDIYPRTFENRKEEFVENTFNTFYSWVATYDLIRQWVVGEGDFKYDFMWLTSKYSNNEVEDWASGRFKEVFGISTKQFKVL